MVSDVECWPQSQWLGAFLIVSSEPPSHIFCKKEGKAYSGKKQYAFHSCHFRYEVECPQAIQDMLTCEEASVE